MGALLLAGNLSLAQTPQAYPLGPKPLEPLRQIHPFLDPLANVEKLWRDSPCNNLGHWFDRPFGYTTGTKVSMSELLYLLSDLRFKKQFGISYVALDRSQRQTFIRNVAWCYARSDRLEGTFYGRGYNGRFRGIIPQVFASRGAWSFAELAPYVKRFHRLRAVLNDDLEIIDHYAGTEESLKKIDALMAKRKNDFEFIWPAILAVPHRAAVDYKRRKINELIKAGRALQVAHGLDEPPRLPPSRAEDPAEEETLRQHPDLREFTDEELARFRQGIPTYRVD